MKKLNNILNYIKKYWFYFLLVIPIFYIGKENHYLDNDLWFLLNLGKYITHNGLPLTEPFTIHEGLNFMAQQWLVDVIYWFIYNRWNAQGIIIFIFIVSFAIYYVLYKLYYTVNNNKGISFLLATLAMYLCRGYFVSRPQIFTFLILISETFLIEKYIKSNNKKYLYIIPVLSIILINCHASMWWFQFVFMLPFLVNAIHIKKITIDKYNIKPLIVLMLIMFLGGFINPYGINLVTYIFKSYGYSELTSMIGEMGRLTFDSRQCKLLLIIIGIILLSINFFKKRKLDIRHICFLFGTTLLVFLHYKSYPYFVFYSLYCLSYFYKDIHINLNFKILRNKYIILLKDVCIYSFTLLSFMCFFALIYLSIKQTELKSYIGEVGEYLLNNYNPDGLKVYTDFNTGQYIEYLGYKSYIDGRAEVFYEKFNGKEDIMKEYYKLTDNSPTFNYEDFLNKYNFDLILIDNNSEWLFDEYIIKSGKYNVVYTLEDDETNEITFKVYELVKDNE